jgi:hypothetical protein
MWNLKKLDVEDYRAPLESALSVNVLAPKVSAADLDTVLQFYTLYEEKSGRPCADLVGTTTTAELRKFVHDAYAQVQEGRRLGRLRSEIKHLTDTCPYCGYGPIEDLDHLLQRGMFKLFSIFSLNLVPSCATCNRGKTKKPSEDPAQHQIHVYLEDVSSYDFLRVSAQIEPETGGLMTTYHIEAPENMPADIRDRLIHHLSAFDLHRRYKMQVNLFLGTMEFSIMSTFKEGGAEGLRRWLHGTAHALSSNARFGRNDWRTALMRGLAECEEFCAGGFQAALGFKPAEIDQVVANQPI